MQPSAHSQKPAKNEFREKDRIGNGTNIEKPVKFTLENMSINAHNITLRISIFQNNEQYPISTIAF